MGTRIGELFWDKPSVPPQSRKLEMIKRVVSSKKLGECGICEEEIIQLDTDDGESKIYAPHIDGCPNQSKEGVVR